jgi:hypothetical protein
MSPNLGRRPLGPLQRRVPDPARAGVSATSAEGLTGRRWTGGPRAVTLAVEVWREGVPVTEAKWLACEDPVVMLQSLQGRASDRKLRLFVVACCYLSLPVGWSPMPIYEAAERFADDPAALDEVRRYWGNEDQFAWPERPDEWATDFAANCPRGEVEYEEQEGFPQAAELPPILRDVFGNSFRPVTAESRWLTPTVVGLARGVYEDRAYDRLPILADALEDAGCADADLLGHLRSPGPHVRGCWALDLILGKG